MGNLRKSRTRGCGISTSWASGWSGRCLQTHPCCCRGCTTRVSGIRSQSMGGNGEKETIRLTVQQWINTTMMSGLVSARMLDHGRKSWSELGRPCRMVRQIQQILILHLGDRLANGTGIQRMMPLRTRTTGYRQRKQIGHHAGRLKVYRHLMIQTGGGNFLFREPSPKNAPLMIWTVTGYQIALNHSSSRLSEIFSTAPKTGSGPATPSSSTSTATV